MVQNFDSYKELKILPFFPTENYRMFKMTELT